MTLLEYALNYVDDKLAALKVEEDHLVTLNAITTTPELQADTRRRTIAYADQRYRLLRQKAVLLEEVYASHAVRAWDDTPSVVH